MLDYNTLAIEYARNRRIHPVVFKSLVETPQLNSASRVLEIGCGTGNYITAVQQLTGCSCWGVDPSEQMLSQAASRNTPVQLRLGRAEDPGFSNASFDFIFSVDVIHHVINRQSFFEQAYRLLKEGGWLCTVTDSEDTIRRRKPLSYYFPETVAVELKRYPSVDTLKTEMHLAGFIDFRSELTEHPYTITDEQPFREKAFSSLHLIEKEAHAAGLARMKADLAIGPVDCVSRYDLLWVRKPTG